MCAIAGIYNFKSRKPVTAELLKAMTDTMIHRGPDDEGFYLSGPVGLGHRRLSIIDLGGGHQPIANEDGTVWVVFNGEIYNFAELHNELVAKGHTFVTKSDTEVIVHLYEEIGEACFAKLRGMFAIAIWDGRQRKLVLARDRVGKKPLFYYYDGSRVAFASELKAILQVPDVPREIDPEAVADYFSFLYVPAPKSIFKRIRKILPGHYAVITEKGLRESEYWDISFARTEHHSESEWCEKILDSFREAVRLRLMSDVPLGAFLSGGVDSSSVVSLMAGLVHAPVTTCSIGFKEKAFNELDYANDVAKQFATDHHSQMVSPDAVGIVERLVWHYDEPFADSSAVPTYYVSQLARRHVTVALSGDGGDENFAGYRRYYFDRRENLIRGVLPSGFRRPVFGALASVYPKADWAPRIFRGKATLQNLACSPIEAYFRSVSACQPELKGQLFHPDFERQLAGYDSMDLFRHYYSKSDAKDPLSRTQYVDIKTYLTDDILVKVDRATLAHSLEVRAPMLDHKFMELAASIPSSLKLRGTNGKYILKKSLEGILSKSLLYRSKMGFGVPIGEWFRTDLKDLAHSTILDRGLEPWLSAHTVQQIWQEHQSGMRNRATELWTLLMFRLWERQFMAGPRTAALADPPHASVIG
jgi:asparagine synthase (glutamine-hydrolysing)